MPANAIRRSDDKITDKYTKFAEKLGKFQENLDMPKFYEHGKSVTYQEGDVSKLPTFTTNMITLSQLEQEAGKEHKGPYCHKCKGDGLVGKGDFCDCKNGIAARGREESERPETLKRKKHISETEEDNTKEARAAKRRVIAQLEITEEELIEEPMDESLNIEDILSSIESMLPNIISKSNGSMNKMASNIVVGLVNSLDIDDSNKKWLNAQVENGIINQDIFMRNLTSSLQAGGTK